MPQSKWDEQFSKHHYTYGKNVNDFIKEHCHFFQPKSHIACFAEGEGRNAVYLAKKGHTTTAYDISVVGLQNALSLAEENDVIIQTKHCDLTVPLNIIEKYDGAIMVFGHVEKSKQALFFKNILQAVKQGGYILFEVYSENQLHYNSGGPGKRDFLYNPKDILQWIKRYDCKHFYYGEAERNEGYRHTGVGHVIQCIIKK